MTRHLDNLTLSQLDNLTTPELDWLALYGSDSSSSSSSTSSSSSSGSGSSSNPYVPPEPEPPQVVAVTRQTVFPNFIRTLLLNQARGSYAATFPGEEFISTDFRSRKLPQAYRRIRSVIFGGDPDRHMLNYRVHQLMQVIHSTELAEFVTEQDTRLTYLPLSRPEYFSDVFGVHVAADTGNTATLNVVSPLVADEVTGRIYTWWRALVLDGTTVAVRRLTTPIQQQILPYTTAAGISNQLLLPGSQLWFEFEAVPGAMWSIMTVARPVTTMATILARLQYIVSDSDVDLIFGANSTEPMATFKQLWLNHEFYAYKLGALMLAMAYQTATFPEV